MVDSSWEGAEKAVVGELNYIDQPAVEEGAMVKSTIREVGRVGKDFLLGNLGGTQSESAGSCCHTSLSNMLLSWNSLDLIVVLLLDLGPI